MGKLTHYARTLKGLGLARTAELAFRTMGRPNPIHLRDEDGDFLDRYEQVRSHTLVDPSRLFLLLQVLRNLGHLDGHCAEIGVYKGGTARLIAGAIRKEQRLFLFDTFEGMPETKKQHDFHDPGDFADTSLPAVKGLLEGFANVTFCPGRFPETAGPVEGQSFAFVHIDADIYQSVKDSCAVFYPKMVAGGWMVFDDYGFLSCAGARTAVNEFFVGKPERPIYLPTGQAFIVKQA